MTSPWTVFPVPQPISPTHVWDNRSMVELSAWLCWRREEFLDRFEGMPAGSLKCYWAASRKRWAAWMQELKAYPVDAIEADAYRWELLWRKMRGLLAEIFATEPVTRLWGALIAVGEARSGTAFSLPITQCVLSNHASVIEYVHHLLEKGPRVPASDAIELNHLHYHAQRWGDLLLAPLISHPDAEPFAADAQRSLDFHHSYFLTPTNTEAFWKLFSTSVRLFFRRYALNMAPSCDENRDIVGSMLSALPEGLLDHTAPEQQSLADVNGNGRLNGNGSAWRPPLS